MSEGGAGKRLNKRLIVNADDFGTSPGVSRGILEAHLKGIVTSTSVMIGEQSVEPDLEEALRIAPKLGLGLHFTLSGECSLPVSPPEKIPSLVRSDGTFYPLGEWREHYPQFDGDDIVRELTAQWERFVALTGQPPDHLDSHHHAVYRHPAGLRTLFDLAERYDIPVRNVGFSATDAAKSEATLNELFRSIAPEAANVNSAAIREILAQPHAPWPDRFEDGFYDKTATLGDLLLILTNLPPNTLTELMCHPGHVDTALVSDYSDKREAELDALTQRSAREVLAAEGIELVTFKALRTAN